MPENEKKILKAIAKIINPTSKVRGTCALINEDIVLTAFHVVASTNKSNVQLEFCQQPFRIVFTNIEGSFETQATVIDGCWSEEDDWALLKLVDKPNIPFLSLLQLNESLLELSKCKFKTFGFSRRQREDGMVYEGNITNINAKLRGREVIQLYSLQVASEHPDPLIIDKTERKNPVSGLSGAPVIVYGSVVGVIRCTLGSDRIPQAGTLYATPIVKIINHGNCLQYLPPCYPFPNGEAFLNSIWSECKKGEDGEDSDDYKFYIDAEGQTEDGITDLLKNILDQIIYADDQEGSVILLGEPGAGKSLFLKHYSYLLAKGIKGKPWRIPIYVNLRGCDTEDLIECSLNNRLKILNIVDEGVNFEKYRKHFIVLLDGVDEMSFKNDRPSIQKSIHIINSFIKKFQVCVISCRDNYFNNKVVKENQIKASKVYLTRWGKREITEYLDKKIGEQLSGVIFNKIKEVHNLRELAQNPLLLNMIAESADRIISGDSKEILSSQLYKEYAQKWIERRDYTTVLGDDKQEILEAIAWWIINNERNQIPYSVIIGILREKVGMVEEPQASAFEIHTNTFLINSCEKDGGFSFIHKSFWEYFSACYFAREIKNNKTDSLSKVTLPEEIIKFLAELIVSDFGEEDSFESYLRLHHWLEVKDKPEDFLLRRNSANILRAIHKEVSVTQTHDHKRPEPFDMLLPTHPEKAQRLSVVRMGWLRSPDEIDTLHKFLEKNIENRAGQDDEQYISVLRMALLVIGLLGDESQTEKLIKYFHNKYHYKLRHNCAVALGLLGKENAIPYLSEQMKLQKEPQIRRAIVWAIESINPDQGVDVFIEAALKDPHEEVRQYAVMAIGRTGGQQAIPTLRKVLDKEQKESVCEAARKSLKYISGEDVGK